MNGLAKSLFKPVTDSTDLSIRVATVLLVAIVPCNSQFMNDVRQAFPHLCDSFACVGDLSYTNVINVH